jgi:uncharacterized repeat protein (TIGR03943 family)
MGTRQLVVLTTPVMLGLLLAWELVSGRIYLYVHDRSFPLVALSVPLLLALSIVMLLKPNFRVPAARAWGLAIVPLALALLVPARPLGAAALDAQQASSGASLTQIAAPLTLAPADRVWDIKQLGLLEASGPSLLNTNAQRADLVGFVHRSDVLASDEFAVGRFLVRCCTADAVAVSLPVEYAHAADLASDTWVEVQGTIRVDGARGSSLVVVADSVQVVDEPARPYLQLP